MRRSQKILVAIFMIILAAMPVFAENSKDKPVFALVLSGGGAKGIAHIPVIQELEKRGIVPDMVLGTSMGSLIGGFYAAGYTGDEIESLVLNNNIMDLVLQINNGGGTLSLITPDSRIRDNIYSLDFGSSGIGASNGLVSDQALNGLIRANLSKVMDIEDFDQLSIPFRAVSVDAITGEIIVFDSGSLFTALRSSMAIPLIFPPVKLSEEVYAIDGGMANNMPVNLAKEMGADIVLAVDVTDAKHLHDSEKHESLETLSGVMDSFFSMVTIYGILPQYEIADWVLVPDTSDITVLSFDKTEDVLQVGRDCVEANLEVFDKLEELLTPCDNEFPLYRDRPEGYILGIEDAGLKHYHKELNAFIGQPINNETMIKLETLLDSICSYERYKNITYSISDGIITLEVSNFQPLEGVLALGLTGGLGIRLDGTNPLYFSYNPNASVAMQYHYDERDIISLAAVYHDGLTFEARYSTPISNGAFYNVGVDFRYMNLSYNTMHTTFGNTTRGDFGIRVDNGLFWRPINRLILDFSFGGEYMHLSKVYDYRDFNAPALEPATDLLTAFFKTTIKYSTVDSKNAMSQGLSVNSLFAVGMDYALNGEPSLSKKLMLGYKLSTDVEYVFGPDMVKGVTGMTLSTNRRYPKITDGFVITNNGIKTHDFIYVYGGVRVVIPNTSIFFDACPMVEFFQAIPKLNSDYYTNPPSLVPFSSLNGWSAGVKLGAGISTGIGQVYADVFLSGSDSFRLSIMVGIR